jgi:hypothetical protein
LWDGHFSIARIQGSIVKFVDAYLAEKNTPILYIKCDGDIFTDQVNALVKEHLIAENIIVATLAQRWEDPNLNYLYLPLDDEFFDKGTEPFFPNLPPWEERSDVVFWRGGCSGCYGGGLESVRCRTVAKLIDQPQSDVKLSIWWSAGKKIPDHYFADRVPPDTFLKYNIFLIIDGKCIASNHMWGFATGCVPFVISNANCWFLKFAKPFVHYIPIRYDLEDLLEKIDWVRTHDAEAKQIAQQALQFSKDHFNPEFQRHYLIEEMDRLLANINKQKLE